MCVPGSVLSEPLRQIDSRHLRWKAPVQKPHHVPRSLVGNQDVRILRQGQKSRSKELASLPIIANLDLMHQQQRQMRVSVLLTVAADASSVLQAHQD